jgi:hypothetical protein
MSTERANYRLLILACSATKNPSEEEMPAIDRYDGPLWQTLRAVDRHGSRATVLFLSAHYGLRKATTLIEGYDQSLTPALARQMIRGGIRQHWPPIPSLGHHARNTRSSRLTAAVANLSAKYVSSVAHCI